jgi:hypothetical protein
MRQRESTGCIFLMIRAARELLHSGPRGRTSSCCGLYIVGWGFVILDSCNCGTSPVKHVRIALTASAGLGFGFAAIAVIEPGRRTATLA